METTLDVQVDELVVETSLQLRVGGTDADHVRALEETPDSWPPLKVVRVNVSKVVGLVSLLPQERPS